MVGPSHPAHHARAVGPVFAGGLARASACPARPLAHAPSGLVCQSSANIFGRVGSGTGAFVATPVFSSVGCWHQGYKIAFALMGPLDSSPFVHTLSYYSWIKSSLAFLDQAVEQK